MPTPRPDYSKNVLEPLHKAQEAARQAAEAQAAQEAANQAQAAYVAPAPVYSPPNDGYKAYIYLMESGNNPGAINAYSGACGLGQALPCSKLPCSLSDYACQDAWFTGYALSRYGSWQNAYYFWLQNHWW